MSNAIFVMRKFKNRRFETLLTRHSAVGMNDAFLKKLVEQYVKVYDTFLC